MCCLMAASSIYAPSTAACWLLLAVAVAWIRLLCRLAEAVVITNAALGCSCSHCPTNIAVNMIVCNNHRTVAAARMVVALLLCIDGQVLPFALAIVDG